MACMTDSHAMVFKFQCMDLFLVTSSVLYLNSGWRKHLRNATYTAILEFQKNLWQHVEVI